MELLGVGGGTGGVVVSGGNVPAFLTKLWTLVEDPETDPLICWSPSGTSFHVFDQGRFSKEVLPKFFKHNNMASFIRQLNMYGFRKVVHIEQGGLVKPEKDDTEFQHPFFVRGQEQLLENIKRKVTNVSSVRQEEMKISSDEVSKILSDVQLMKGKQETIDSRIIAMKHENEALWREVASLRQKHAQQQKVVNKLIQFLVSLVHTNRIMGVKRKIPLMLNDSSSAHSVPKYSRPLTLEHIQNAAANLLPADSPLNSGPIISDITEEAPSSPEDAGTDWTDLEESHLAFIKEEPSSPEVEECPVLEVEQDSPPANVDTPLSPTTFINSILQDDMQPPQVTSSTTTTATSTNNAADHLQDHVWKEEVFSDQQLCKQERNSSLDQEEPEPLQIKDEPVHPWTEGGDMDLYISKPEEQFVLKQETADPFMVIPSHVVEYYIEPEPIGHQVLSQDLCKTENQDQEGNHQKDSRLNPDNEPKQDDRCQKTIMQKNCVNNSEPKRHKKTHTNNLYSCKICGDFFSQNSNLALHMKTHTGQRPFLCLFCGKSFTTKYVFNSHVRIHTGEKPFSCETCGKGFTQKCHLTYHMRTHTDERPFPCNTCKRTFRTDASLNKHRRTHTDERPYPCNTCEKTFKSKYFLDQHVKTHTAERPFLCLDCGKGFTKKSSFNVHVRIHTGEKPFSCVICGKGFNQKSHLISHMRTHTAEKPFPCNTCEKNFRSKSYLDQHMRTHTAERPFLCLDCGKSFTKKSSFIVHVRIHTGEKPFSCTICGKGFTQKCNLTCHMRTHTDEKHFSSNTCEKTFGRKE